jgi:hypothetical protein
MTTNHTPGPWHVHQYHETVHTSDRRICTIVNQGGSLKPGDKENAKLIAASPQMLEVLVRVNETMNEHFGITDEDEGGNDVHDLVRKTIKEATE